MGIPVSREARLFYRAAARRYDDATALFRIGHNTGAVYLAGYAVECILKSLVLAAVRPDRQQAVRQSFRGKKAHDFEWLRTRYSEAGGASPPGEVSRRFALVSDWSTDLRYSPADVDDGDAARFVEAAATILRWGDGRL